MGVKEGVRGRESVVGLDGRAERRETTALTAGNEDDDASTTVSLSKVHHTVSYINLMTVPTPFYSR